MPRWGGGGGQRAAPGRPRAINAPFTATIKGRLCGEPGDSLLTPHHLFSSCSERKRRKRSSWPCWEADAPQRGRGRHRGTPTPWRIPAMLVAVGALHGLCCCSMPSRCSDRGRAGAVRAPGALPRGAGAAMALPPALLLPPRCSFEVPARRLGSRRGGCRSSPQTEINIFRSLPPPHPTPSVSHFHSYFPAGFEGGSGFQSFP